MRASYIVARCVEVTARDGTCHEDDCNSNDYSHDPNKNWDAQPTHRPQALIFGRNIFHRMTTGDHERQPAVNAERSHGHDYGRHTQIRDTDAVEYTKQRTENHYQNH